MIALRIVVAKGLEKGTSLRTWAVIATRSCLHATKRPGLQLNTAVWPTILRTFQCIRLKMGNILAINNVVDFAHSVKF